MGIHVVAIGNAFDGIRLVGFFNNGQEAVEWAEDNVRNEEWCAIPVNAPETEK